MRVLTRQLMSYWSRDLYNPEIIQSTIESPSKSIWRANGRDLLTYRNLPIEVVQQCQGHCSKWNEYTLDITRRFVLTIWSDEGILIKNKDISDRGEHLWRTHGINIEQRYQNCTHEWYFDWVTRLALEWLPYKMTWRQVIGLRHLASPDLARAGPR